MIAILLWAVLSGLTVAHADSRYTLVESYNSTNFFEKFNFFKSNYSTGNYNDVDPTSGFVNYRSQEDAMKLGLIATQGSEVFLGVNHRDKMDPKGEGRDSVRLESKQLYNHGLFIAEFTHLPKPTCGSWPAFWTFGDPWPVKGEMDIIENWNLAKNNMCVLHTGSAAEVGNCTINQGDMSNGIISTNCDSTYQDDKQALNQGCSTDEAAGQWGSESGGVYVMEWSSDFIKVWSWSRDDTPKDIRSGKPRPQSWGKPHFYAGGSSCNVERQFRDQKLVLNITFCGAAAGNPWLWGQQCRNATGYETCAEYVANHPDDFADAFWKIKHINVFQMASNSTKSFNEVGGHAEHKRFERGTRAKYFHTFE